MCCLWLWQVTAREGAVDVAWQDVVLFCAAIPRVEICTWIHTSGVHIGIPPYLPAVSWSFSNELSVPLLSPAVRRTVVGVLPIPSFVGPYNAWCSHTAHSALVPGVLYRSTGYPSPFRPTRLVLARLAPTLSKLERFNASSFQICLSRGPSATNGRPRVRRMRILRERRVARSLSLPTHILSYGHQHQE